MTRCPSCGREPPGEFPFCPFCGVSMTPAEASRQERKVVTAIFVDLAGFTARAERLDPEEVRGILAPYHDHVRRELLRFGGTVEKFIGDAVMAVFGAPIAHEDDPERAIRAALAIRDWARDGASDRQIRIGVNTGEALVLLDADPAAGEGLAAGDVVNTAARLQAAAPLDGVLVGEATYRATNGVVEYRPVEAIVAKGKAEPVAAWEAVATRSRIEVDPRQRHATTLIGREHEVQLLGSTLDRVRLERASQLVTIVGVPGIGKSRLVFELLRKVHDEPEPTSWRQGRSLPYGDGVTFWALGEIVKAEAGILEDDSSSAASDKLHVVAERLTSDASEAGWIERHLQPLVGLAETGPGSRDEAFAAWRRTLQLLAAQRPLVCVFEDLHWADDALLDFLDRLVERTTGVPLLVLGTARPELLERRPTWGGGKANALTISLSPLAAVDASRLVDELVPVETEPGVRAAILERAGGNPLYAEQFAHAVDARGRLEVLPDSVHGIVAARLDALSPAEKRVLQDAAVVGDRFWLGSLEAVGELSGWQAEELLHTLERKEFVHRAEATSTGDRSAFVFRHAILREVAYRQIPRAVRADKHARVADWLDADGRPEDRAELLAHHRLAALDLATQAGLDTADFAHRARLALRDAGDRAASLHAIPAARRFYEAALQLWPADDPERASLLFRRAVPAERLTTVGDVGQLTEAIAALMAVGDRATAAEGEMLLQRAYWTQVQPEEATIHAARALELIEGAPPSRATATVMAVAAQRANVMGDLEVARERATSALDLARQVGWPEGVAAALSARGSTRVDLGDPAGLGDVREAIRVAEAAGDLGMVSRAYNALAVCHVELADLRAAGVARLESLRIARQIESDAGIRWHAGTMTDHHYRAGTWDEAIAIGDAFLRDVDAGSPHYMTAQVASIRAEIRLARGDGPGALEDAERALAAARSIADPQVNVYVHAYAAHVHGRSGDIERARALASVVLDHLRAGRGLQFATISLPAFAFAAVDLGMNEGLLEALSERRTDRWIAVARSIARGAYASAAAELAEIGSGPDAAFAHLQVAEGDAGDARSLEAALAFYRSVGATAMLARAGRVRLPSTADAEG